MTGTMKADSVNGKPAPASMTKAKFRVGQVVRLRSKSLYFRIGSRNWQRRWYYWKDDSSSVGFSERELRKLTKRERGQ